MNYAAETIDPRDYGNAVRSEGTIQRLTGRVEALGKGFHEVGVKLREHADAVHGGMPEAASGSKATPCRSGQLGALEDAIDRLEEVLSFTAEQAGRNTTLA